MTDFAKTVRTHFDFLASDFGFVPTSEDAGGVRYDSATLCVEIGAGKGEIDLVFRVKVDTDVLRPYISHVFSLAEVVRYYKTGPFPRFDSFPPIPGASEEQRYVIYLAALTRNYCEEILRGDITALERLSVNRGAKNT
ncbi:MAG TPA: hypothetical protein VEC56_09125 [Candidatus Krumholzibacteria bacterium]|nr:hypothetical protein [Candidatus Krumholzibacteria bacterium]